MNVCADTVAGAMEEVISEAFVPDVPTTDVINFKAGERRAGVDPLYYKVECLSARIAHDLKNVLDFAGNSIAAETGPSDVVINRVGCIELGPHVDQDQVA